MLDLMASMTAFTSAFSSSAFSVQPSDPPRVVLPFGFDVSITVVSSVVITKVVFGSGVGAPDGPADGAADGTSDLDGT